MTSTAIYDDAKGPSLKDNTFFVRTTDTTGFFVDDNVKVVFIQKNDNKWTTDFEDGVKELEAAVGELNVNDAEEYNYEVIKGGAAQVVVIRDLNATGKDGETPPPRERRGRYLCRSAEDGPSFGQLHQGIRHPDRWL